MFEDLHMIYDLCVAHFKWKAFKQQSFDIIYNITTVITTLSFFQAITILPNLTK